MSRQMSLIGTQIWTAAMLVVLLYGAVVAMLVTPPLGFIIWPLVAGIAFVLAARPTAASMRVGWIAPMAVAGFLVILFFGGLADGSFSCWDCHEGDSTKGGYFVFGAFLLGIWTLWALLLMAVGAAVTWWIRHYAAVSR